MNKSKRYSKMISAVLGASIMASFLSPVVMPAKAAAQYLDGAAFFSTTTTVKPVLKKPVVGPGVEGLDYSLVLKWQQNVDAGRELWRLDPLMVAKNQGKIYGFRDTDTYTIVKKYESTSLARHGEVHVAVKHGDKTYTLVLVRPFGSDSGAIWTVHHVIGIAKPQPPADNGTIGEKVLYFTDKYANWHWYAGKYPKNMAFATIADYQAHLKYDSRIPEFVLQNVKDVDYSKYVVLFAALGTAPSGGYGVAFEKVTMKNNHLTVQVRTKSPAKGDIVTQALTYPYEYILVDRKIVDIWGGMHITFIDQYGKVLSKNLITISHK